MKTGRWARDPRRRITVLVLVVLGSFASLLRGDEARRYRWVNDVWNSADGIHWSRLLDRAPWAPRQYHEVAVFDDRSWVLERYSGQNRNDVWYSADGTRWDTRPAAPWAPRHAASVFVHQDSLWVVAGNNTTPDVWKLIRADRL